MFPHAGSCVADRPTLTDLCLRWHQPRSAHGVTEASMEGVQSVSDQTEGAVADAGRAAQQGLNQAGEATEQLSQAIRHNPLAAVLVAIGIGYVLGKIV